MNNNICTTNNVFYKYHVKVTTRKIKQIELIKEANNQMIKAIL